MQLFLIQILLRYSIGIQLQWFHVTHPIFTIFMYRSMAVAIVLDLSLPNELWNTMETLLSQVKKGFDICREVELTSVRERLKLHNYLFFWYAANNSYAIYFSWSYKCAINKLNTSLWPICVLRKVIFVIKLSASAKSNTNTKSNRYTLLYKVFTLFY